MHARSSQSRALAGQPARTTCETGRLHAQVLKAWSPETLLRSFQRPEQGLGRRTLTKRKMLPAYGTIGRARNLSRLRVPCSACAHERTRAGTPRAPIQTAWMSRGRFAAVISLAVTPTSHFAPVASPPAVVARPTLSPCGHSSLAHGVFFATPRNPRTSTYVPWRHLAFPAISRKLLWRSSRSTTYLCALRRSSTPPRPLPLVLRMPAN
ncbi:hypothetical protein C2E23DRAFT_150506 [Lenzites betulinus]|nr:hypothetical protein C2E23DRAFT_150506 [Lenzites betulinus]